ncbi:MAG: response regulator transcription factor [Saprospiraceae bacterium]|nr:response regulator transcription factor [Saprospiraceae bacterium]
MNVYKVLIVEDEILIADNIKKYLLLNGYAVSGIAISYDEAIELYETTAPDIVLLDIRLNGKKTGIDVGNYINDNSNKKPFLFLTSQLDKKNIDEAKKCYPAGYLSKPIQHESLRASIDVALHNFNMDINNESTITLVDKNTKLIIPLKNIQFIRAEHVYVRVFLKDGEEILHRSTLKDLLLKLPVETFIHTHRSFIVNIQHITSWSTNYLNISDHSIPMSRSKKKIIVERLSP